MAVNAESRILVSSRSNLSFLEHCRVHMEGDRLVYATSAGGRSRLWSIPTANSSAVLLGPGTSITQAAARKLASERVLVAFVGGGGLPIFMGSINEYAPTESLVRWIGFWNDPGARLAVAKFLAKTRCEMIERLWPRSRLSLDPDAVVPTFRQKSATARTIEELRGYEGDFAKSVYREAARSARIAWNGRRAGEEGQDQVNSLLDRGNYIAYGAAGVALWTQGIPAGLAVNHGVTRAGGLVFDLADTVKDAWILPCAFGAAAEGVSSEVFRDSVIEFFDTNRILPALFDALDGAGGIGAAANVGSPGVGMSGGGAEQDRADR